MSPFKTVQIRCLDPGRVPKLYDVVVVGVVVTVFEKCLRPS